MVLANIRRITSGNLLCLSWVLSFIVYLVVLLDLQVVRQIVCFVYFAFVPGLLFLNILKLNQLDYTEKTLFSAGISISFLMIIGLILNALGPSVGISRPLSITPLIITLNTFVLFLGALNYIMERKFILSPKESFPLTLSFSLLTTLPILSIVGAVFVTVSGNNFLLLITIVLIAVTFILGIIGPKHFPSELYPAITLLISVALLFQNTIVSKYIHGPDIQLEYYLFKRTQINGFWNAQAYFTDLNYAKSNAMLSVTILPTIYSDLLNIDATWTYKIIFPLIFALVPLGVYKLAETYFGKKVGLVSAFLFVSEITFFHEITAIAKEMIGELFFVLLFLILLSKKTDLRARTLCFVIFSFALVTSHYTMALVFLFFGFCSWALSFVTKDRNTSFKPTLLLLFFSIMFFWYIYTYSSAPFTSILDFLNYMYSGFGDFFNPASRGTAVLRGIGAQAAPTFWQLTSRYVAYAVQGFIVVGGVASISRRIKRKLDREFVSLVVFSLALLGLCVLLPKFASSINMSRFFHISLFFLAPMFALGCETLASFLFRKRSGIERALVISLVIGVLIPYFLFQTDFVYEVAGQESWSVPLSGYRMGIRPYTLEFSFLQEPDVFGAVWLSKSVNAQTMQVYADRPSTYNVLASYGMFYRGNIGALSNTTTVLPGGTIFLCKINVVNGIIAGKNALWNSSDVHCILDTNKVYTNGNTEICQKP